MRTIELKEEFRKALEENGLYEKFMKNLEIYIKDDTEKKKNEYIMKLNELSNIIELLYSAFIWKTSKEGEEFWINAKDMIKFQVNKIKEI